MSGNEIRQKFLKFFESRGHKTVPSSSLVPEEDPSVLLTTAGMQQFKPYFTGQRDALKDFNSQRTCSVQKSFRTTDIESVGDESHLTFFEMLGNFSFGPVGKDDPEDFGKSGYFKRSAIAWGKDFITKELGLNINEVTVFGGAKTEKGQEIPADDDSFKIWQEFGFDKNKILKRGLDDNFWGPTGDEGPCGPTSEIYLNGTEVWNLVFNEFYSDKDENKKKLINPGIDTGMGLERLAVVLQNKSNVFETDFFAPLMEIIESLSEKSQVGMERQFRILADHARASFFLTADGVMPSNLDRGYILRRLIRRAMLQAKMIGLNPEKWVEPMLKKTQEIYGQVYPELLGQERIIPVIKEELDKFEKAMEKSLKLFDKIFVQFNKRTGLFAFEMLQSHGLPLDLTRDLLLERKLSFTERDEIEFYESFQKHQKVSRGEEAKK